MLQFVASLSIIAEILGQEKIIHFRKKIDLFIDLKRNIKTFFSYLHTTFPFIFTFLKTYGKRNYSKTQRRLFDFYFLISSLTLCIYITFDFLHSGTLSAYGEESYYVKFGVGLLWILLIILFAVGTSFITFFSIYTTIEIVKIVMLTFTEGVLYIGILYLNLSGTERKLKIFSFILFCFGFFISLIFS